MSDWISPNQPDIADPLPKAYSHVKTIIKLPPNSITPIPFTILEFT
ncbi:MAG: hypothetical protein ACI81G_001481 [Gammaproteobacteria bacterium]|jgi:hypothetical protein